MYSPSLCFSLHQFSISCKIHCSIKVPTECFNKYVNISILIKYLISKINGVSTRAVYVYIAIASRKKEENIPIATQFWNQNGAKKKKIHILPHLRGLMST